MTEISRFHATTQIKLTPGLVSVLLPLLKKGLFTQGSGYPVPLDHYPGEFLARCLCLVHTFSLSVLTRTVQDKLLKLKKDHAALSQETEMF